MKVIWSPTAIADLEAIAEYIAQDRPQAAWRLLQRFRLRTRRLAQHPRLGRVVPEWEAEDIRELIEAGHRIIYKILPRRIEIVTVLDGRRCLPPTPSDLRR